MSLLTLPTVFAAIMCWRLKARSWTQVRLACLEAILLLAGSAIVGAEVLGFFHLLYPGWISLFWILASVVALAWLWRTLRQTSGMAHFQSAGGLARWRSLPEGWQPQELLTLGLVIAATGLIAVLAPPTNYDAMTYHLPRVMHWLHQGSLEHYPAANVRQLAYGPGAAYWQLHLWALADGDQAAHLPQWGALVGCVLALSLWLEAQFGRLIVGIATVFAVTLPMALLQASSAQTDLLVSFWLLTAVVFLHRSRTDPSLSGALFGGLALGLAVLTKPSAALCVAPIAVAAFLQLRQAGSLKHAIRLSALWTIVALAICLPHFTRNQRWFGKPLGDDFGTTTEAFSPGRVAANWARWAALNVPVIPVWTAISHRLHEAGIDPNDPAVTLRNNRFAPASSSVVHRLLLPDEDYACYLGSILLAGLAALAVLGHKWRRGSSPPEIGPGLPWLAVLLLILGLNFTLLKWQVWGNRLLLPWAMLAAPTAIAWSGIARHRRLRALLCGALLLQAAFVLVCCLNRPWVRLPATWSFTGTPPLPSLSREAFFFAGYNADTKPLCDQLVMAVRTNGWRNVGLSLGDDYAEYPLWRALHAAGLDHVRLHHMDAKPPAGRPPFTFPTMDGYIVATRPD